MLTIICGEDSVASREYFSKLKNDLRAKGSDIQLVAPKELEEKVGKSDQTLNLFGASLVFATENLNAYLSRGGARKLPEYFENIVNDKSVVLIDWENEKGARDLKIAKLGEVKEFKLSKNIFQLLDACYPKNLSQFSQLLSTVCESQDEMFIFTMLSRHVRTLVLARTGSMSSKVAPWQRGKLSAQSKLWDEKKLTKFYEGFSRIDVSLKTSSTPFSIRESLDILACYYL